MIFHRDLEANQRVCPYCGYHFRLSAEDRLKSLLDDEGHELLELPHVPVDPLKFRDSKRYTERLREAQAKTRHQDALLCARGTVDGLPVVLVVMNFAFMGGSMGAAVGEGFLTAARRAVADRAALVVVTASGGARMQEGAIALMQMARTTIAVDEVKEAGLPYIVILTDPTTGGVTASFAMLGDVHIAEPGAIIGFAGARVIEQTIREKLPEGFQRAEYLLEHGMVDQVVNRLELRDRLAQFLDLIMRPEKQKEDVDTQEAGVTPQLLPEPGSSVAAESMTDESTAPPDQDAEYDNVRQ